MGRQQLDLDQGRVVSPATRMWWRQVLSRDPMAHDLFIYAVTTTGIYCRPTCPSRRPHPDHVRLFDTGPQAASAGYRPCRRCHPDTATGSAGGTVGSGTVTERLIALCRWMDQAESPPSLHRLAARAGLSPSHFHRRFKAVTGLTPKAYAAAVRRQRMCQRLQQDKGSVTEALYDAGFNASSRFYETSNASLGMTPTAYRDKGAGVRIHFAIGKSSLGAVLVAGSDRGICAISLGDDPEVLIGDLERQFSQAELCGGDPSFDALVAQVIGLVDDPTIGVHLPLDLRGTTFQMRVWQALQAIPPGQTVSYQALATSLGMPSAARAVAGACAANHLAVAVPCHRVVRRDGSLSGYRWGVERKKALLEKEEKAS